MLGTILSDYMISLISFYSESYNLGLLFPFYKRENKD